MKGQDVGGCQHLRKKFCRLQWQESHITGAQAHGFRDYSRFSGPVPDDHKLNIFVPLEVLGSLDQQFEALFVSDVSGVQDYERGGINPIFLSKSFP
jgi:hypothetical protein